MRLYEAMFVVNHNAAKENYDKAEAECQSCVTRHGGEVVNCMKWDERRLAYEIQRQKRATFILMHFTAPGEALEKIEKQCRLSETILRAMVIVDEDGEEAKTFQQIREETVGREGREGRDGHDGGHRGGDDDRGRRRSRDD